MALLDTTTEKNVYVEMLSAYQTSKDKKRYRE
jgi:hypothetical protein